MRLTEQEIDKMVHDAINEYDNWNYPLGADADPRAPWNQVDPPTDDEEYDYPLPTTKMFLYVATELMDINDASKLSAIKNITEQLPQEIVLYGEYEIPFHWERDEDGGYRVYDYDECETLDLAVCVKEGKGKYTYLPKWMEQHGISGDEESMELIKSIIDKFCEDLQENGIDPRDFEGTYQYSYLDDVVDGIKNFDTSSIGGTGEQEPSANEPEETEQNVMNESAMRNLIYEKVLKALDECC